MSIADFNITGIGIGPFNLGLAALLSRHPEVSCAFLERKPEFRWHEGLLLPGTTLQVPFFADLVTMADPTHPLSYLNYLHQHDRLYQFYYYDSFLVPRREYDHYCRWAAQQLPSCHFGENVMDVCYEPILDRFVVESESSSGEIIQRYSQDLAIGIGTTPWLPKWAQACDHPLVRHSADFLRIQAQLMQCRRVTVVGSGQSAAECVLALFNTLTPERVDAGASIQWITRSAGFHPMEYSKLGQECFTPTYMQYFHSIPREKRREIVANQGLLYKGISISTIGDIFDLLYERSIGGRNPGLTLHSNCEVESVEMFGASGTLRLACLHRQLEERCELETDAIIAATGYAHAWPQWFEDLKGTVLATDTNNDCIVQEDFTAVRCDEGRGRIFVQNAEIFQHGVGSPDLGIGAMRNSVIINQLLGEPQYRVPERSAFQDYGLL
jgi:lysine N6-hydroxylase